MAQYPLLAAALVFLSAAAQAQFNVDGAPARTLSWLELGGGPEPVIFFGDDHRSSAIKTTLAAAMPDLARAGAAVLAVEMLHASDQPLLDAYGKDPAARRKVGEKIGTGWRAPAEVYLQLLDAAKAAGLELAALNPNPARGEAGESYEPTGPAAPSARNAKMAAALAALAVSHRGSRVLAFLGADHESPAALPAQLKQDGAASRVYLFAQPDSAAAARLRRANLDRWPWLVPDDAACDGLIAVPAVLDERLAP